MRRGYRRKGSRRKLIGELLYWLAILLLFACITSGNTKKFFEKGLITVLICIGVFLALKYLVKYIKNQKYLKSTMSKVDVMSGEDFEGFLKAHFEALGYKVRLTPKTADYGADLILTREGEKIAVQAKRYRNEKVSNKAVQEVVAAIPVYDKNHSGMKGMVVTNSYFTSNAVTQARACNVELWDRDTLKRKFKLQ